MQSQLLQTIHYWTNITAGLLLIYSSRALDKNETECLTSKADGCDGGGVLVQGLQ